jgi:hypothetical protein
MEKMTIAEALSEVKLMEKKLEKKHLFVLANLSRFDHIKDTFEKDGGATKALNSELQSINDLNKRLERIRASIAKANLDTNVTVGEDTRSLHEWITWKREIAPRHIKFIDAIHTSLKTRIDKETNNPTAFKDEEKNQVKLAQLVTHLSYQDFIKQSEKLHDLLQTVDGKLSLKNATIVIEF